MLIWVFLLFLLLFCTHTNTHTDIYEIHFQLDRVLLKHWNYWGLALKLFKV